MGFVIQARYEELEQVSATLVQEADHCEQLLNKVNSQSQQITGTAWIGKTAHAFEEEFTSDLLPRTKLLINALEVAAKAVQKVSSTIADAERAAQSLLNSVS